MRLGIFGGTFSPPHMGHVNACLAFSKAAGLDKLLVIPTFVPPHKEYDGEVSCEDRLEMARRAFSSVSGAEVSALEIKRGGKSYTYLTLEELSGEGVELYFLCGTDMILTLDTWMCFEKIFSLATICYVRREGEQENTEKIEKKVSEYRKKYAAKIMEIKATVFEVSSTEIRRAVRENDAVALEKIPKSVLDYINARGLYR
jgi:nicotinate-nucleotide adenylyltransferase